MMSPSLPSALLKPRAFLKVFLVAVLAVLTAATALPHYWSGQWPWVVPPESPHIQLTRAIRDQGLSVPGWQPLQHERVTFGSDDWSLQQMTIQPPQQGVSQVVLLLKPQTWHTDQPDVEWLDVKGAQRWTIDSRQSVRWETSAPAGEPPTQVRAKFFRAWNQQQTYAAMQWYAWPGGGDPSVSHWFWADQKVQWQSHQRLPWVAVCLLVPLPPLADIAPSQPAIEQLAQTVQTALQTEIFKQ